MKASSFLRLVLLWSVIVSDGALGAGPPAVSLLLPSPGATLQYRYKDTITSNSSVIVDNATVTLTAAADGEIGVTIAMDGHGSTVVEMRIDEHGDLVPVSLARPITPAPDKHADRDALEERAVIQRLLTRLSIATRIGPESSFSVPLEVPDTPVRVTPTLFAKSAGVDALAADAVASTSVTDPRRTPVLLPIGAGLLAGAFASTAGRIVGGVVAAGGAAFGARLAQTRSAPVDVTLHIDGHFTSNHLQDLIGDQQVIVYKKRHKETFRDRWSFVVAA